MPSPYCFHTFLLSYRHAGKTWGFEILATSTEDVRARLSKMATGKHEANLFASVPVHSGLMGLWQRKLARK